MLYLLALLAVKARSALEARQRQLEGRQVPINKISAASLKCNDEEFMREVFNRHADSSGELSAPALMAALKEVEAPVLASSEASAEHIFRRADANLSGAVDFQECEPSPLSSMHGSSKLWF
jgi:hypothetical protein